MARFTDVNAVPASGAEAFFRLKEVQKDAGWTVPLSSDGTTYNASGDQITHAGSGAGGMANVSAWYVVREPGGRREYCLQIDASSPSRNWRIKYSPADRFTGGSPGATRVPSATDEQVLTGGGTDASPTFNTVLGTDASYRCHCAAESDPINDVYYFCLGTTTTPAGSSTNGTLFLQDGVLPGSGPELDGDPAVILLQRAAVSAVWRGFAYYGTASESWVTLSRGSAGPFPSNHIADPNGADVTMPAAISNSTYWKGLLSHVRVRGANKDYPNTINLATDAYVYYSVLLLPWETGTTPQDGASTDYVGEHLTFGGAAGDAVAPVIGAFSPAAGAVAYTQAITVPISDNLDELSHFEIWAEFASQPDERVWSGDAFSSDYSTSTGLSGGNVVVRRDAGWPAAFTLKARAWDADNNPSDVGSAAYTVSTNPNPAATDTTPPTVTLISPTDSRLSKFTPIVVDIGDDRELGPYELWAYWENETIPAELVRSSVRPSQVTLYTSSMAVVSGKDRVTLVRKAGWERPPRLFTVAVDAAGNVNA